VVMADLIEGREPGVDVPRFSPLRFSNSGQAKREPAHAGR
jgi:hypothetical protein